mmetsp:Transcript_13000/g.30376  ORF Transcript_13000/g.30376 Transcript_13000/m.30376 type:complete len:201 (+) Transcript_13000:569-1171(+)
MNGSEHVFHCCQMMSTPFDSSTASCATMARRNILNLIACARAQSLHGHSLLTCTGARLWSSVGRSDRGCKKAMSHVTFYCHKLVACSTETSQLGVAFNRGVTSMRTNQRFLAVHRCSAHCCFVSRTTEPSMRLRSSVGPSFALSPWVTAQGGSRSWMIILLAAFRCWLASLELSCTLRCMTTGMSLRLSLSTGANLSMAA